jgi:hypothetical protein
MANYRSTLPNFYSDKGGSYVQIGAIVPVLVDNNSDPTNNLPTQDPHYSHRGYLYCDGSKYSIKDYPLLYENLGNGYLQRSGANGNERISANAIIQTAAGPAGTVYRTFVDGGNVYAEIYGKEIIKANGVTSYDRVVPHNATLSFRELKDFPGSRVWKKAVQPYASVWSEFMKAYSVYVSTNQSLGGTAHTYTGAVVDIPSTGNYKVQYATDNTGTITFNGTTYSSGSSFEEGQDNTVDLGNVPAGSYPFSFSVTNGAGEDWANNPGGIAIRIYDDSNNVDVWATTSNVANTSSEGVVQENKEYNLSYASFYQNLAERSDTHVYRLLVNYDPTDNTTGTPGATVTWSISSSSVLASPDTLNDLAIAHYGTVPAIDPGTYDPLTGGGYPTNFTQYKDQGARNDTMQISWGNLFGMPQGVSVDTYEVYLEDLSIQSFVLWNIKNIPSSKTGMSVNEPLTNGVTKLTNSVEQQSIGSSPEWVNNGYSGPQPPDGEKHKYRLHVIANLTNQQTLVTHMDFAAGSGQLIPDYGSPAYTDNYDITGTGSGITNTSLNIKIGDLTNQPEIRIRKGFELSDYPYILGEFRVPDYRDRKLIGYGEGIEGSGSPLVGDRITMNIGDIGGQWYIPTSTLESPQEFYEISDVVTTGYSDVISDISAYATGEKTYRVGPTEDYIFARPAQHNHYILGSVVLERSLATMGGVDTFTTQYVNYTGGVLEFVPGGPAGDGGALGHSHGLAGSRPANSAIATYGNTDGIGEKKPSNYLPDKVYAVDDPTFIEMTFDYNDLFLTEWGSGAGETGGFANPGLEQTKYAAYSSLGTTLQDDLAVDRGLVFDIDCSNYTKLFVLAIAGNDYNGGERPNHAGEGLTLIWPDGSTYPLLPSKDDSGLSFDEFDAAYAFWKRLVVDIPPQYQTSNVRIDLHQVIDSRTGPNEFQGDADALDAANPNAYDSIGVAQVGLTGGTQPNVTWDGCYNYNVTTPPTVQISSTTSDGTFLTVTTATDHGFAIGDAVTIALTNTFDGTYTVEELGFSNNQVRLQPQPAIGAGSVSGGTIREAGGYFVESQVQNQPRVWVVDNVTTIGGKEIIASDADLGQEIYNQSINSGTLNVPARPNNSSTVSGYEVTLLAPGGGGGGSFGGGGNGGSASATLTVDGINYTITANGGQGGSSGNGGGGAGGGGTYSIPAALLNDDRFNFDVTEAGTAGSGKNGGQGGGGSGGTGGDQDSMQSNTAYRSFNGSGSFNPSSVVPSGGSITGVYADISGGGGGNGPGNGAAGCGTTGGTGSRGRRLTGNISATGNLSFTIGQKGGTGQNIHAGSTAESTTYGGGGAAQGGTGGRGAWGNGGSGGGGGGATQLSSGVGNLMGAGGGGGGGGNGGGNNGGSVTDPCWTGGPGLGPGQGLYTASSIGFTGGGAGSASGCTAGGGGGGGGGAGPNGGGNGGLGGQAGAGHVNTGSGSGGQAGRSAVNTNYVSGYSESSGSSGSGYANFTVSYQQPVDNPDGGGGGSGSRIVFSYKGDPTAIACSVGNAGAGGSGNGGGGSTGTVTVSVYERIEGDDNVIGITSPAGRYYEVPNFPSDAPAFPATPNTVGGGIWHSSSLGVEVTNATGANFPVASTLSGTKATKYVLFSGAGSRYLQLGPFNLTNVNQATFTVIRGNNTNGGDAPEEGLFLYYKTSLEATSETLLSQIAGPTVSASGYANYSTVIDDNNNARANGIYLILRQNRPVGTGDNDEAGTGDTNDNWGLAQFGFNYDPAIQQNFVPSVDATLPSNLGDCGPDDGIDRLRRTVSAAKSNMRFTDGQFQLSSSTPISVTASARVQETIPLITRYHRAKYLIKAF